MNRSARIWLLSTVTVLVALSFMEAAEARCVNTTTGGTVTDGIDMPQSGESVVCDTTTPNPSNTTISSVNGSTGVTIIVSPGATVSTTARAIGLDGSTGSILNQGAVRTSGLNGFGLSVLPGGNANIVTNAGSVTTTGLRGHGLDARGTNSAIINNGTVTVSGAGASGIRSIETTAGTTITNRGFVSASGVADGAVFANGVSLQAGTFANLGTGIVTSTQAFGVLGGDGGITVRNAGTITAGNGTAIQLGNGNNVIEMSAGQLNGAVATGTGTDQFTWSGGGIAGAVGLGAGNDTATLRNLTDAQFATTPVIDGSTGNDRLIFDATVATGFARFTNWENVDLTNGSRLTLDGGGMPLGDAGTGNGALTIDPTSTLYAGNGVNATIRSFTPGQLATVTNSGMIDLTNGGSVAMNTLTVAGNYIGAGGTLRLNAMLGTDGSPSDKLVIAGAGASAGGTTGIAMVNTGGGGAATFNDGIAVVQVTGGATTAPGSFSLAGPAVAGAYEYLLYKGGLGGANPDNWYLRSTLLVPIVPGAPAALPQPLPLPAGAPPGFAVVQLIRPEAAVHSVVPDLTRTLGLLALGTFHERRGDQALLDNAPAAWGRVFGQHSKEQYSGGVRPDFSGTFAGFQTGFDAWRFETFDSVRNLVGVSVGHARATGDVSGFVLGVEGAHAGTIDLGATSLGGYWTMIGSRGWYVDTVVQGDFIDGTPHSDRNFGARMSGANFTASIEGGLPIALGAGVALEPQAQFIYQHLGLNGTSDGLSSIGFAQTDVVNGRIGMRLKGTFGEGDAVWTPYLKGDVWWRTAGTDDVAFATNVLSTVRNSGPAIDVGGGVSGRLTQFVSLYGEASYRKAIDDSLTIYKGNIGLRVAW